MVVGLTVMVQIFTLGWVIGTPPDLFAEPFTITTIQHIHTDLERWLECTECDQGELKAVIVLGKVAIPTLVAALKKGPSQAKLEQARLRLKVSYKRLEAASSNLPTDEAGYIQHYLKNYLAQYQIRAAIALSEIGGQASKQALEEASSTPLRNDVAIVVKRAIKKVNQ